MENFKASLSLLANGSLVIYFLRGLMYTLVIAVSAILISIVFGSILALVRNYCTKGPSRVFKYFAVAYIELFRNTPLMLWLFFCLVYFPAPHVSFAFAQAIGLTSAVDVALLIKAIFALTLFTSSVMAEIIRGGLNSIDPGQFEAGYSQGFNFARVMIYIILPQAYRAVVPTMLSQIITTVKDTSYVANIASVELLRRIYNIINTANKYTGLSTINISDYFVLLGAACVLYFAVNFTISCVVRAIQKHMTTAPRQAAVVSEKLIIPE